MITIVFALLLAAWVWNDARKRGEPNKGGWTFGCFLLGVFILPLYLAKRPLFKGEVREGGTAWNVLKTFGIIWTVVCAWASVLVLGAAPTTEPEFQALAVIGGVSTIAFVWLFVLVGTVALGLLVKKSSVVETGGISTNESKDEEGDEQQGWSINVGGTVVISIVIGIIFLFLITIIDR